MIQDSPQTLEEAKQRYLDSLLPGTAGAKMTELNRFVSWYGGTTPLNELQPFRVGSYSENLNAATTDVNGKIEPVKDFFKYAKKKNWTEINFANHLKVRGARRKKDGNGNERKIERVQMTPEGYERLNTERDSLVGQRPALAEAMRLAAADKDFRENAPYQEARDQKARVESRIRELEAMIAVADVVEGATGMVATRAKLGATVVVDDLVHSGQMTFILVSASEVDLRSGRISIDSPTGRALLDCSTGETIQVAAPAGVMEYRVIEIRA